jgi:hypothetical protein
MLWRMTSDTTAAKDPGPRPLDDPALYGGTDPGSPEARGVNPAQPTATVHSAAQPGEVPAAFRPSPAKTIGDAVGDAVAKTLGTFLQGIFPGILAEALSTALAGTPVRVLRRCAQCILIRLQWETTYAEQVETAQRRALLQTQLGEMTLAALLEQGLISPLDPRVQQVNWPALLPPELQPGAEGGLPNIYDAVTDVGGTAVCQLHIPAAPGQDAGKPQLLAAPGVPVHLAAALAYQGAPGMPGLPEQRPRNLLSVTPCSQTKKSVTLCSHAAPRAGTLSDQGTHRPDRKSVV